MVEPLLYQSPSSFFQFTSSLLPFSSSLLPIHFQSTSSLLPVFIQTPPTSKSTFLCQFFSLYELWANSDSFGQYILFWLICLKPYSLKDRYPMYTIEKTNKIHTIEKTKKNNLTNWNKEFELPQNLVEPLLYKSPSSFFQSTSSLFQSTSNPLPVYFQFSSRLQPTSKSTFLYQFFSFYEVWANNNDFGRYIIHFGWYA